MTIMPHDHRMWAVIGIYTGGEDNMFWRLSASRATGRGGRCAPAGRRRLPLGRDIVHSVTNPIRRRPGRSTSTAATSSPCRAASGTGDTRERPYDVDRHAAFRRGQRPTRGERNDAATPSSS